MSDTNKKMTTEEVYEFIDQNSDWSENEKNAVRQLYRVYVSCLGYPKDSFMSQKAFKFKSQLKEQGIIV